jgi:hypothetical protein
MVAAGFLMKAPNIGEYEPHPGCDGLHINPLELIGVIINVVLALAWETTATAPAGGHIFRIWANNTSALSWIKNTSRDTNPIIHCLICFLMAILIKPGIPCILQGEHIPDEKNVGAGRLSHPTLAPMWVSILADCPEVKLCRSCQVPPGLLSTLASTIYSGSIDGNIAKEMIVLWTRELLTSHTG